ncbi:MAG: hypothetical protein NVSMB46_00870 [Candidatus Saccharimonadales bacterium]
MIMPAFKSYKNKNIFILFKSPTKIKFTLILLLCAFVALSLSQKHVSALNQFDPATQSTSAEQSAMSSYDSGCTPSTPDPQVLTWISLGSPYTNLTTYQANVGDTSVNLSLNRLLFFCHDTISPPNTYYPTDGIPNYGGLSENSTYVINGSTKVTSAVFSDGTSDPSPGSFSPSPDNQTIKDYVPSGGSRYWYTGLGFTYVSTTPFTKSETITLTLTSSSVNVFNGTGYCVTPNGSVQVSNTASASASDGCPQTSSTFTFYIDVPPPTNPAQLTVQVSGTNATAHIDIRNHDAGNCLISTGIDVSTASSVLCQSAPGQSIGASPGDPSILRAPTPLSDGSVFVNWSSCPPNTPNGQDCPVYIPGGSSATITAIYRNPAFATLSVNVSGSNSTAHIDIQNHDAGNCLRSTGIDVTSSSPVLCQSGSGLGIGASATDPSILVAPASLLDGSTFSGWSGCPVGGSSGTSGQNCSIYIPPGGSASVTANYSKPPPSPSGCPSLANPDVQVNLPDLRSYPAPYPSAPSYQSGYSYNPPGYGYFTTQYQDVNDPNPFEALSANDQWGQAANITAPLYVRSNNPYIVGYEPFITQYPYDTHQPTVSYYQYFTSYYYTPYYGQFQSDPGQPYIAPSGCTTDPSTGVTTCTNPGQPYIPPTYFWWVSWGSNSYPNSRYGSITPPAPSDTPGSAPTYGPGGIIGISPCYSRNFNLTPATVSANFIPDSENPSTIQLSSNIAYIFNTSYGGAGVRKTLKVQTNVSANYFVHHADGSADTPFANYPLTRSACSSSYVTGSQPHMIDSGSYSTYAAGQDPPGGNNVDCFNATVPPLKLGDEACFTISTNPSVGTMDPNGVVLSTTTASRTSNAGTPTCSSPIVNKPYVRLYGNDISAGGGFSAPAGCGLPTIGSILGNLNSPNIGSTDQLAAFALGSISGFGSSQMTAPEQRLDFANTGTQGMFGYANCVPDYFGTKNPLTSPNVSGSLDLHNADGAYYSNGNLNLFENGSGFIMDSNGPNHVHRIAVFVSGDVSITSNLNFRNGNNWDIDHVPTLWVIASGNINIAPNVTQLDGVYIAQPNPAGTTNAGRIFTCAIGNVSAPPRYDSHAIYSQCANQLTVNGAFIAQEVKLQRTFGSWRDATTNPNEYPSNPRACSISTLPGATPTSSLGVCAAEVFNFSPNVYLAQPPFAIDPSQNFDSISSLAPVL